MRCQFDFTSILEELTIVGSHEIIEAATDPDTATGWGQYPTAANPWTQSAWLPYGGGYPVEIGDYCISSRAIEGGVAYQRMLGNAAAAAGDDPCVPPLAVPYYNEISAGLAESSATPPPIASRTIDAPLVTIAGTQYHTMTIGQTSVMHVTMGAGATSGQWRVFWLYSYRLDATGADGIGGDDHDHLWRVGVYVP